MKEKKYYTDFFYNNMHDGNTKTAKAMMPSIINYIKPKSVVDVGCGRGIFLKAVKDVNPNIQILGIDGDYIDRSKLLIKEDEFLPYDLSEKLNLERKFDLAISLEVAEHINEEKANVFVDNLVRLSDKVVFSAAIPMQGGTHHVNEQWMSYWKKKFEERGYRSSYYFRNLFWENEEILPLRRQNIMFYVKNEVYEDRMDELHEMKMEEAPCDVIHPDFWCERANMYKQQIDNLQKDNEWQNKVLNCILNDDFGVLKKDFDKMNIFDLADKLDVIEYIKRIYPDFWESVELEIDRVSKEYNQKKFIIFGAGEDGQKIKRLLEFVKKDIEKVCDSVKVGNGIVSFDDMIKDYAGEIIILASRKYREDMLERLNNIKEKNFLVI